MPPKLHLVDRLGRPLSARYSDALEPLIPRFRRRFRMIQDEALVLELFEETGSSLAEYELANGPTSHLESFAWRCLCNRAISFLRTSRARLLQNTRSIESDPHSEAGIAVAGEWTPEVIQTVILWEQLMAPLNREERVVFIRRQAGFTSKETAAFLGTTKGNVDTMLSRARAKMRQRLDGR